VSERTISMMPLLSLPHGTVELNRPRRLVRMIRSATPFATLDECRDYYEAVATTVEKLERRVLALLVDVRAAPARNDPAFESTVASYRRRMFSGFARVAVLVKTAAGKLNVARHAKDDGVDLFVFQDADAALAWLDGSAPTPSSRRR
jgi:hypothetical protein